MTLMVLDDQTNMVRGIVSGVDWAALGIEKVIPAYYVAEAKEIMEREPVDILLCDIEMPVENGLSFLGWVREKGLPAECIFLTSHAEFQYAREAVRLGSFDYITQPAPYDEIRDAVERAMAKVRARREQDHYSEFGRAVGKQNLVVAGGILRDFLLDYDNVNYREFERLGFLPALSRYAYLVLLHCVSGPMERSDQSSLIQYAFDNILTELFAPYEQQVHLAILDDRNIALVISPAARYQLDSAGVERILTNFCQVCRKHFDQRIACYGKFLPEMSGAHLAMQELMTRRERNVSMADGVFFAQEDSAGLPTGRAAHQAMLGTLFANKLYGSVRESSERYLDQLAARGQLSKEALEEFYQEFLSMCYSAEAWDSMKSCLSGQPGARLLHDADRSIVDMKRFVRYITETLAQQETAAGDEIQQVIQYIHDNIEEDLKCSELADYVHLSSNYLTKRFKKETGIAIKEYIIQEKLHLAQVLLTTTNLPVNIISSKVGYSNFAYFSKLYKQVTGKTPSEERQGAQG